MSIILPIYKIHQLYILIYYTFIIITFLLISTVSVVIKKHKNQTKDEEHFKWDFFIFLLLYIMFIVLYIILFAFLYILTFWLGDGGLSLNGVEYIFNMTDALSFSSFMIFGFDVGFFPYGFMNLFMSLQLFISQIVIFGFLLVLLIDFIRK